MWVRSEPDDSAFDDVINWMEVLSTNDECLTESAVDDWLSEMESGKTGKFRQQQACHAGAGDQSQRQSLQTRMGGCELPGT